jgi:DMSO/TMAO reductase YedYZ molybdopterin-dependent catalytic subunit
MNPADAKALFPTVGNNKNGLAESEAFYREELQLAARNRGMPLEALRYPITPASMHYLLVHYDIPEVNTNEWSLKIGGRVANPLSLTLDNIRQRPAKTMAITMECAGNGRALFKPRRISQPWLHEAIGTAEWTGTSLRGLLEAAGLNPDTVEIVFTGLDRGVEGGQVQYYQRSLTVSEATRDEVLLAYAMNGEPLPPQHGYPLRLMVPGWYGMTSVKWLDRIEAVAEPFAGYQMLRAYRYAARADDPGDPVNRIRVRALMAPPGIPDFMTRTRLLEAGWVVLKGRAWAGRLSVSKVEVSTDSGFTWAAAQLDAPMSPYAWRGWSFQWDAAPGEYALCVRATDSEGSVQPSDPEWNTGGYGNNAFQRVHVIVKPTVEGL